MIPAHSVVPALPIHLRHLAERMRAGDRFEMTCLGISPKAALWRSYRASLVARTWLVGDEVAAMGGCSGNALGGEGELWLLTSVAVERVPVSFVKEARKQVREMLDLFPSLCGMVLASYTQACGFLDLLGFDLGEPVLVKGAEWRCYRMVR